MKYTTTFIVLAFLLVAGCTQNNISGQATTSDELVIGVIAPLSGESSVFGQAVREGVELAAQDFPPNVRIVYQDDQLDNAQTVSAFQTLVNQYEVDAVIGVTSGSGHAIAPLAEQEKVLLCVTGASDPEVSAGKQYVMQHWTSPKNEAKRYLEELRTLGWDHVVLLATNQQGVLAVVDALRDLGPDIEWDVHVLNPDQKDARTVLQKAQREDFDTIAFFLLPGQLEAVVKQARELGIEEPYTAVEAFGYTSDLDSLEGEWFVNAADPSGTFASRIREKYGHAPGMTSGNAYDCANIMYEAFTETSGTPEAAAAYIHEIDGYVGVMGPLTYDGGVIDSPAVKQVVKDGAIITED